MQEDKAEISVEILQEIFKMANIPPPKEISDEALLGAVLKLKMPKEEENHFQSDFCPSSNNILVIDDIGVVTYQLKILLKNLGYNVQVAKDIFSGNGEGSMFMINIGKPLAEIKAFDLNRQGNKLPSPCVAPTMSAGLGIGGK